MAQHPVGSALRASSAEQCGHPGEALWHALAILRRAWPAPTVGEQSPNAAGCASRPTHDQEALAAVAWVRPRSVSANMSGMAPGLYFKSPEGELLELEPRVLGETSDLQPLLARAPQLLAGDRDGSTGRYVLVQRELGIAHGADGGARWSLDHLFLDDEGVPTLVEVKQSANTQIRREVVGQLLEYAANFANYWSAERIRNSFEGAWRDKGREPDEVLQESLGAHDAEVFWATVDERITARRLRLVFLADAIPSELRQIIEYLNEELRNTEVLGIEIREHAGDGGSLITSRTVGATEAARVGKGGPRGRKSRTWTLPDYLAMVLEHCGEEDHATLVRLVKWAKQHDPPLTITFGTGLHNPGMQIGIKRPDAYLFPFALWSRGGVEVNFQQMANVPYPPFHRLEKRTELQRRLIDELGVDIPDDRISLRPNFSRRIFFDEACFKRFLAIYEWTLAEALASGIGLANLDEARAGDGA